MSRIYFFRGPASGANHCPGLGQGRRDDNKFRPNCLQSSDPRIYHRWNRIANPVWGMSKKEETYGGALWILPVAGGSAQPVDNLLATDAVWGETAETILYCKRARSLRSNRDGSNRRSGSPFPVMSTLFAGRPTGSTCDSR